MSVDNNLFEIVQNISKELLSLLLANEAGIKEAVISSVDGFEVSSIYNNQPDVSKLSALSSSLSAIGAMATKEVELGKHHHVLIEGDEGFIMVMSIPYSPYPMIFCIVASGEASLSDILEHAKNITNTLVDLLPSIP